MGILQLFQAFDPNLIFSGLATNPDSPVRALGALFLCFGAIIATVGTLLSFRKAKSRDEQMDTLVRTFVVVAFLFFGPWFVRESRTFWNEVQVHYGCKPMQVASNCVLLAARFPELDSLFQANVNAMQGNAAQQANDAAAIGDTLDRYGNGLVGRTIATLQQTGRDIGGFFDRFNPLTFLALAAKVMAAMLSGAVKLVITVILGLFVQILMLLVAIVSALMEILQLFLIIMMNMLLPTFIGMFALPDGNPFRNTARNFVLHLLAITMWPLAWTIGHVGTMALFNAIVSAPSTAPLGAFSGVTFQNISTQPLATAAQLSQAVVQWQSGTLMGLLFLVIGIVMITVWVFYVTIKLPWMLNDLIISGADMMGQAAKGAMSMGGSAVQEAGKGAGAIGREMQMAQLAATVASGGAAAPLAAAGAAAGAAGGGGGMMAMAGKGGMVAGLGGLAQGGISGAVSGFGPGRMAKDAMDMQTHRDTSDALKNIAKNMADKSGGTT